MNQVSESASIPKIVYILDDEIEMLELLADTCEMAGAEAICFSKAEDFFSQVNHFGRGCILV